jgi:hypothetical protein
MVFGTDVGGDSAVEVACLLFSLVLESLVSPCIHLIVSDDSLGFSG